MIMNSDRDNCPRNVVVWCDDDNDITPVVWKNAVTPLGRRRKDPPAIDQHNVGHFLLNPLTIGTI